MVDLVLIVSVIFVLTYHSIKPYLRQLYFLISKYVRPLTLALFVLIVFWQFYVVKSINGKTMWDANMILTRVADFPQMKALTNEYLSVYPNNILLYLYERGVWLFLGKPDLPVLTLFLARVNIALVDFSIIVVGHTLKGLFNRYTGTVYWILGFLLMGLSPWIAVPYSDIWAFFFSSAAASLTVSIFKAKKIWQKIIYPVLLAIILTASYFMKPSLIIFYIAAAIVGSVALIIKKSTISFLSLLTLAITTIVLALSFNNYQKNIPNLNLNENRAFSMMHFAAMGSIKMGAYNPADYFADKRIKDPDKRNERDIRVLKKRIVGYKNVGNYQRFLIRKHVFNTADGGFNWAGNGNKIIFEPNPDNFAQKLFTTQKISFTAHTAFSFPVQIFWILTWILTLFSIPNERLFTQIFKYSIVGFFLFLLMFEGGKSRYMIQLLPFILILASIGADNLASFIRKQKSLSN
ncbi:integral membrane protein [Ligilactobacillus salitolerans]|uniref:Integral membrane protein n=1 Tax=Ligilactobacillus salitolerans TaxID=1808352 RepID=A0A401IW31_9LACO|nr:integral membrane protein [Ligilactobacillus salitolerans]